VDPFPCVVICLIRPTLSLRFRGKRYTDLAEDMQFLIDIYDIEMLVI